MKRFFLSFTALCCAVVLSAATVNYTADNTTIFSNPERGFITMLEGHLTTSKPYAVKGKESTLDNKISSECMSIILVHYYLDNFKTTATLPSTVLNAFDEDMAVLRSKGMKAIIRFSYTNSSDGNDAAWNIAKQHISQYKSHWQANADVIFCFQAGIVGAWGEWYYTQHYGNQSSTMNSSRRLVVDSLLAAVPADRCIQLRTPKFKTGYVGNTQPLTAAEAYSGTAKARLGHHNDAFLYDYDNMGTYADTATEKPYLAQETLYVPLGGETDITDLNLTKQWATYEKTTAEMSRLHWTFIQSGYAETTTNYWRNNGTFDELNRKMGYRYQLVKGTYSDQVAAGAKLSVNLQIKNVGYAPLYNERHAYIVLKNGNKTYPIRLASDPRTWLPNGVVTTINEQLTVPTNVPDGTYQLYLYLPDAYASIASDPRYAVRFANTNVWEAATGMNKLNASVTVTGGGVTPPEPPVSDAITLPATLNKANVTAYSDNMSWYNTDYFDFGPTDAQNTDRWAEWNVYLRYPGEYIVTVNGSYPNGHQWQLTLAGANKSYTLPANYATGEVSETGEAIWDLSTVAKGEYTLKVQNIMAWGQPKLKNITLQYNGELPLDIEHTELSAPHDGQTYDLLGRPVDDTYKGVVIQDGKKIIRVE
jgi:hypothetical protein